MKFSNKDRYHATVLLFIVVQLIEVSLGLFFPISNFFNKFRNSNGGGFGAFSGGSARGNVTSFRIPMLVPTRRVDVFTTVGGNTADQQNETYSAKAGTIDSKLIIPTSTSVTKSISTSKQNVFNPSLTLPFTPNLFGMMSYVQALKDIKRNFHVEELQRKLSFHTAEPNNDLMTRILRTLIQKVVNKYQKRTELLKLQILKRQDKLANFLQLPMVSQVVASESLTTSLGKDVAEVDPKVASPSPSALAQVLS